MSLPYRELENDYFIVEGVAHEKTNPANFVPDQIDNGSPLVTAYPTLDLDRFVVIQSTQSNNYADRRKLYGNQVFVATWEGAGSASKCLRDHLYNLDKFDKKFWLQYDDEMSRYYARLICADTQYKAYFTPTHPIAPFGYTPDAPEGYENTVFVNDVAQSTGFTVDSYAGCVVFDTPLTEEDIVTMAYTWKAYVQIAVFDMEDNPGESQVRYSGTVVFHQIEPIYGEALDFRYEGDPCVEPEEDYELP